MLAAKEVKFGRFRLDFKNECLWQGTRAISLRPKAFAVLRLLVEHPGELVNKQQVLDTVWPGTFVGDAVLKDNVRQLREALGDDAECPTYIETAHRRGYRFIGKLSESPRESLETVPRSHLSIAAIPNLLAVQNLILGRDAELVSMRAWLDGALAGKRQLVFVTGEPGIGKTSLVQAFLESAAQLPDVRVVRGQCLEHYGAGEAYLPVLDGFSRLCRSSSGSRVLEALRQRAPAWLAQMPSLVPPSERGNLQTQGAGATRERMLREMTDAIEMLTSESPLLMVLEDLHWSDYSTLDLISYLARRQDPARLMIIGTYRPVDVIVGDHPLKSVKRELQAHGLCHELPLEYLTEEAVGEYLGIRFPRHQMHRRLRRTIYRRTEGNPLFMVNLVKYLTDQSIIVEEYGTWRLRGDLSEIEESVPANLRQLIERQIERLTADERTVLEGASVAGMECSSAAIAAGLDMPLEWVEQHCDELACRHQFLSPSWIVELPDGTITPRRRFVHILYRDVPYRLMSPMRRSQIHQRTAERGIAIYGECSSEIAAELAMHFEQSRDWSRALEYLLQAAENAISHSAHHEAVNLANRGLEAIKFLPETVEHAKQEMRLRMILGVSLMTIKGFASEEVEKVNARGRELFWLHGPSPELFYMLWLLGLYYQFSGDLQSSLKIAEQIQQLAQDLKDGSLIMEAHRAIGGVLVLLGRCVEALPHLEKGTALYETHRNHPYRSFIGRDCKVICGGFSALSLWALGYPDQAAARMAGALKLARELRHPQTLIAAGYFAVHLHQLRGEVSLVYERAKEVQELADEYGLELWLAYASVEVGWAEAEMGNREEGIQQMMRGLAAYDATGAKLWSPHFLGLLADQLAKTGRVREGLARIEESLTQAQVSGDGYSLPELYRIKGELMVRSSQGTEGGTSSDDSNATSEKTLLAKAQSCFAEALDIAQQQQAKSWELRIRLSMALLQQQLGRVPDPSLAESYAWFSEGFETADLKQARMQIEAVSLL